MPPTDIAILAKAPVPGFAKTRLIPAIGAHAAAVLQERLTERAVATARDATIGDVTVWCAPDTRHRSFRDLDVTLRPQPEGDLGARMLAAFGARPTLVIGTDCPALTAAHLRDAADALATHDVVLIAAEDGGYVLIGARAPHPELFVEMTWSVPSVLAETRARIAALGLTSRELPPLWDVDTEDDLARMEREFPELAL
ncbi:MAG TPA: TIGR04282 family arsenosugar biosynthesis glycosyltransferase [Pseudolabrys sp.]|uniref:TIGR04282 family arsenosugar biosynthesis glycosyltransferase n=1 Tax=Pseudolabrys sp. TaxID=1960880 RepID=UPI002DDD7C36|nr:TIGR04282 family arsenosugar biosynthesis glycosyltransferase [Pseudolabrys sp.]HEV2629334.1 TIGR04282 family arsenosugar biosynthesis glycosyltransferase [Pseudolabrys sp.]